jgi:hypothetical protein
MAEDDLQLWQDLLEETTLLDEIFDEARRLNAHNSNELKLRQRFNEGARLLLSDGSTRQLVEHVLNTLCDRQLPMPVIHCTSRSVRLPDGRCVPTGFVESIVATGFRPLDSNVGAFVVADNRQWRLAQPVELDPVSAVAQTLLFVFRYLKHGTRTNKASLGALRGSGQGVPVFMVANPRGARLRPGADADDHYVVVHGMDSSTIIGALEADDLSPGEIARELFMLLNNWLCKGQ